ncbi:MAG TPA: alpha/beta fold hydrolase [Flavihumibacter sp.]|nr:alpha/beta fold hydrolase [Flavihumibacter sp.]
MKKIFSVIVCWLLATTLFSQDIKGDWYGTIKLPGGTLRLVLHISPTDTGYSSTLDSPDQLVNGIPVAVTHFSEQQLYLDLPTIGASYKAQWKANGFTGSFSQGGKDLPLHLSRQPARKPQEPIPPFPYPTEEVHFRNVAAGIELAGTLSLPAASGKFPVAVMITGSGPQNRDEELLGHKPFLVIADYLTRNGIAVLRFDDRGVGKSTGHFASATSADFASDVKAAVAFLRTRKEIDRKKIGLIGHSEGGMIAPMVAADEKDIRFTVLLAGPGIPGSQLLLLQQKLIMEAADTPASIVKVQQERNAKYIDMVVHADHLDSLRPVLALQMAKDFTANAKATDRPDSSVLKMTEKQAADFATPWMQYFLRYNPAPTLEKVTSAVLAVNGSKDLQVPAKPNLDGIKTALEKGGNKNFTTKEYPGLNHLFQTCKTGLPAEYAAIEQTFSPEVLADIAKWIQEKTKQ